MSADAEPFLAQLNWLVDTLLTDGAQAVVIDAAEGYNPVHDVCHGSVAPQSIARGSSASRSRSSSWT